MGNAEDASRGWKLCPSLEPQNGMEFPFEGRSGKCVPEFCLKMGCRFPKGAERETLPRFCSAEMKKELELRIVERLSSFSETNI